MWHSRVERVRGGEILPILALLMLVLRLGLKKKYYTTKSQKPFSTVGAAQRQRYQVMKIIKAISFSRHIQRTLYG
jgi:hypothetical protein